MLCKRTQLSIFITSIMLCKRTRDLHRTTTFPDATEWGPVSRQTHTYRIHWLLLHAVALVVAALCRDVWTWNKIWRGLQCKKCNETPDNPQWNPWHWHSDSPQSPAPVPTTTSCTDINGCQISNHHKWEVSESLAETPATTNRKPHTLENHHPRHLQWPSLYQSPETNPDTHHPGHIKCQ